ncbi:MAG: TRAP transporter small permease [Lentisphaeria bacterium]|nr:TRAP transporter small permease [Lentisphaeria bacterium]MDY0176258.1 TRAP transporter small permease [Lentisphaeria bacterium]NLZ60332.1 TRAP transporter small permease [Lentisphaerota bacterium]
MSQLPRKALTTLVLIMASISGASLLAIIAVTGVDILLRRFNLAVHGAIDIVELLSALCISFALPYTTAVKGHIAVEFLFRRFNRPAKLVSDSITRSLGILLFAALSYFCFSHGYAMLQKKAVSLTLNIPRFWAYWQAGFAFAVVILIKLYHLANPGKELIKP